MFTDDGKTAELFNNVWGIERHGTKLGDQCLLWVFIVALPRAVNKC